MITKKEIYEEALRTYKEEVDANAARNGLCFHIKHAVYTIFFNKCNRTIHIPYSRLNEVFPEFESPTLVKSHFTYWWPLGSHIPRIKFMEKLIADAKDNNEDITETLKQYMS